MNVLNIQTKSITSAAFVLGAASGFSALLGFLRDRLLASRFGAGNELDVYYAAFRIPDFISMVLIMGSISAAVVPIFSSHLIKSREEAWNFFSNLLNLILLFSVLISAVLFIFTPQLMNLITPGFSGEKKDLVVLLTRIMFLSPIILGTSNIITSVLQVFRRFLITSLAPIMYNVGIISGILFFAPRMGIVGLAWGVVLGAALHFLIQLPVLFKVGFKIKKVLSFADSGFREVLRLTIPRSIGLASTQINFIVVTAIASTLSAGSLTVFSLSESLSRPLLILTGISFSTAAFPQLALSFSKEKRGKFLDIYSKTFSKIVLFIVPLSLALFFLRNFIVDIILRVGKFGLADSRLTAACLAMFAIGLFARSLILLTVKAFYAIRDTKTPALASILAMAVNIVLSFLFIHLLSFQNPFQKLLTSFLGLTGFEGIKIIGLPLALSVSAIFQILILFILFKRKINKFDEKNP
ncbi:MAG: murein biosynthesis integral membrane protein MurJ [Candidatus Pacebacteria bacterium]|nr:murein biosynthesis integral membrane protein MurJ [Candidatus Paceibacterota bacterium]